MVVLKRTTVHRSTERKLHPFSFFHIMSSDYLTSRLQMAAANSSYLAQLGIAAPMKPLPQLDVKETLLQNAASQLLEIVDFHLRYWQTTRSKATMDALSQSYSTILSIVNAIHQPENRLAHMIHALWQKNLKDLCRAMLRPVIPKFQRNNQVPDEAQAARLAKIMEVRARVDADKQVFKATLVKLVRTLRDLVQPDIDKEGFKRVLAAPTETVQTFLLKAEQDADAIDAVAQDEAVVVPEAKNEDDDDAMRDI